MLKKFLERLGIITTSIQFQSEFNKMLEIHKQGSRYILDTQNANYSYGSLFKAFQFAFQQLSLRNYHFEKILMLGMGAGCVLEILQGTFSYSYSVDAVEIDPVIIQLAYQYFDIKRFNNLNIIQQDAYRFVLQNTNQYDFIIVDLFIDLNLPEFLFEAHFLEKLQAITTKHGAILINTIPYVQDNNIIIRELEKKGKVTLLERYKNWNEMIFWEKQN